jgi:bifunctional DNA-binding transcriptional regulator/antitoxin component of YhaV-PrlF toxin-antitoxin module
MKAMAQVRMPSRVGERGQITVEKAIREQLAVYAGDEAVQWVEDGRLVVAFVPGPHRRSLAGSLAGKVTRRPADDDWTVIRDAARAAPDPDRAARVVADPDTRVPGPHAPRDPG